MTLDCYGYSTIAHSSADIAASGDDEYDNVGLLIGYASGDS